MTAEERDKAAERRETQRQAAEQHANRLALETQTRRQLAAEQAQQQRDLGTSSR